jgi:hypothetical protein
MVPATAPAFSRAMAKEIEKRSAEKAVTKKLEGGFSAGLFWRPQTRSLATLN